MGAVGDNGVGLSDRQLSRQSTQRTMSSEIRFKGLLKKITILIIVALSNVLQQITGDNVAIREIVIMFYIANEGISVLENVAVIIPANAAKVERYIVAVTRRMTMRRNKYGDSKS